VLPHKGGIIGPYGGGTWWCWGLNVELWGFGLAFTISLLDFGLIGGWERDHQVMFSIVFKVSLQPDISIR
jgi:hypothetical protein